MNTDREVSTHYSRGDLLSRLNAALSEDGIDPDHPSMEGLAPYDQFHGRGLEATLEVAGLMEAGPADHILDIGSGIGGPARYFATRCGCRVTGIDLTPEYCDVARHLTRLLDLEGRVTFEVGNALRMPFADASFDRFIVTILLAPLRTADVRPPPHSEPREGDPLWQIGHAAFDACRALVSSFDDGDETIVRFGDHFHGRRNREPWGEARPEMNSVFEWWNEILSQAAITLAARPLSEPLPKPVEFTAYTVQSLDAAYDYVLYHTSFHLGVAQGKLA